MTKTPQKVILSVGSMAIGLAIPFSISLYSWQFLAWLYGPTSGVLEFGAKHTAIHVALSAAEQGQT